LNEVAEINKFKKRARKELKNLLGRKSNNSFFENSPHESSLKTFKLYKKVDILCLLFRSQFMRGIF